MTAPELKPCPFCGCAMEITDDLRHYNHPMSACFGRHIGIAASDIDRIEMWNRRADIAAVQPAQVLETCGKCMGSGYGGHPDSGQLCADCNGSGGGEQQPDPRDEVIARLVEAATHLCDGIATMLPPLGQSDRVLNLRAAIAAAKAVQHD